MPAATTATDALIAACRDALPEGVQEKIGQAFLAAAYPKPVGCVVPELATMAPTVVHWPFHVGPHMCEKYHTRINNRRYEFEAQFFLKHGSTTDYRFSSIQIIDLDMPKLSLKYPMVVYATTQHTGSLHISPFYLKDSLGILRTLIDALYVVARRYNFNIMCGRLYWDHATRKQKSVRRFYKDLSASL